MTTELEPNRHLDETDYLKWIENTVKKLRVQDYSNIDWENLSEELKVSDIIKIKKGSIKHAQRTQWLTY